MERIINLLGVAVGKPNIFRISMRGDQYISDIKEFCAVELRGSAGEIKIFHNGRELDGKIGQQGLYEGSMLHIQLVEKDQPDLEEEKKESTEFNIGDINEIFTTPEVQDVFMQELGTSGPVGIEDLMGLRKDKGATERVIISLSKKSPEILEQLIEKIEKSPFSLFANKYITMIREIIANPPESCDEIYPEALRKLKDMGYEEDDVTKRALLHSSGNVEKAVQYLLG